MVDGKGQIIGLGRRIVIPPEGDVSEWRYRHYNNLLSIDTGEAVQQNPPKRFFVCINYGDLQLLAWIAIIDKLTKMEMILLSAGLLQGSQRKFRTGQKKEDSDIGNFGLSKKEIYTELERDFLVMFFLPLFSCKRGRKGFILTVIRTRRRHSNLNSMQEMNR